MKMKTICHRTGKLFAYPVVRLAVLIVAAAMPLLAALPSLGQSEEGIKTAFLYNFAKFTEWPAGAFPDDHSAVTVGFVGADSLAASFEKNIAGKNANGRDFVVKRLNGAAGVEECHILFIGAGGEVAALLQAVKGKPVLTVGEGDDFVSTGGMIRFVKEGAKLGFDLALDAIREAKLEMDSKVRQIARTVKGK